MTRLVEIKARYYGHIVMVYFARQKFTAVLQDVDTNSPIRLTFSFSQLTASQVEMLRPMLKINMLKGVDSNGDNSIELFFQGENNYPQMEEE